MEPPVYLYIRKALLQVQRLRLGAPRRWIRGEDRRDGMETLQAVKDTKENSVPCLFILHVCSARGSVLPGGRKEKELVPVPTGLVPSDIQSPDGNPEGPNH